MSLAQFCQGPVVTITESSTLTRASELMAERNVGSLIVTSDREHFRPIGILTDRDIVTQAIANGADLRTATVASVCSPSLFVVAREFSSETAVELMLRNNVRRLLIVDAAGQACGFVSATDLIRKLTSEVLADAHQLNKISDLFLTQSGTSSRHRSHDFTQMA